MIQFKAGDHLVTNIDLLGITEHHGLYTNKGMVIHQTKSGIIEEVPLEIFSNGNDVRVKRRVPMPRKAIEEARSHLGEMHYQLFSDNCEHFINKVSDDSPTSNQVSNAEHLALQAAARTGMMSSTALRVATSTAGTIALISTASKMAGEYVGLPDKLNTIIGTPGDMVAKPLETALNGIGHTLSDTTQCLSNGEYVAATGKLMGGIVMVPIKSSMACAEAGINGIKAVGGLIEDAFDWFRN